MPRTYTPSRAHQIELIKGRAQTFYKDFSKKNHKSRTVRKKLCSEKTNEAEGQTRRERNVGTGARS